MRVVARHADGAGGADAADVAVRPPAPQIRCGRLANRNVDQAFRTTILTLNNGQSLTGLLLKEEGEVLVLADQQGKEACAQEDG